MRLLSLIASRTGKIILTASMVGASCFTAGNFAAANAAQPASDHAVVRDDAGRVRVVKPNAGKTIAAPRGLDPARDRDTIARKHAERFAPLFGVNDPGKQLKSVRGSWVGKTHISRFQQIHGTAAVIGGELIVTTDASGNLVSVNGEAGRVPAETSPAVNAATAGATAVAAAAKATGQPAGSLKASAAHLSVFDPQVIGAPELRGARLVWQFDVRHNGKRADLNQYILVDATDGRVVLNFAQTRMASGDRSVCDFQGVVQPNYTCPGVVPVTRSEGQPATGIADVDAAYDLTGAVHAFYQSMGRDGIDDAGHPLVSSVRFCPGSPCPYENAFWDGFQMVFGTGFASADDVVGHELTHGVTEHTSGLLYYYQSGAINESISDVLGELFDLSHVGGNDTPAARWLLGEDLPIGAIRSMSQPELYQQPSVVGSGFWNPDAFDSGGVHTNSGVGNHAAYLMTDGGTIGFITVAGIHNIGKVARIWLGAEDFLTAGSDYKDLAYALSHSCQTLVATATGGITATDCVSVDNAVKAVGMNEQPFEPLIPQAAMCNSPQRPVNTFFDTFNRATSNSLGSNWTETGLAYIDPSVSPSRSAGNSLLMLTPFQDTARTTSTVANANWTTLPASGTSYLHFEHLEAFDWWPPSGTYFDGGFVEIDINNDGLSWLPISGTWENGPDKNVIYDGSPHLGFSGDSRGWTSSRVSLDGLQGRQIKIRFRVETDGVGAATAAYGWWLNNVRFYSCGAANPMSTDLNGDGYGDVIVGEPGRDVGGSTDAGAVRVMFGSSTGTTGPGNEFYTQDMPGFGYFDQGSTAGVRFGHATASGDFNGDGYADMAVGTPGRSTVHVTYGNSAGLDAAKLWMLQPEDVEGDPATTRFGNALAVGDFNGDGYADLAIGGEGNATGSGAVWVAYGFAGGMVGIVPEKFSQDTAGVPGSGEAGDHFGHSLAAGDVNGDGKSDLLVGVPDEAVGALASAGTVVLLMGRSDGGGLTATGSVAFTQDSANVPGSAEADDRFGDSVAIGDLNNDGRGELIVGAPGEDVGTAVNVGTITVFKGSTTTITGTGSVSLSQDTANVPGSGEAGDLFGNALAVGDFNGDGFGDLAVGASGEGVGTAAGAGSVTVLPGSASGATGTGSVSWSQDSAGVSGTAENGDGFGFSLRAVRTRNSIFTDLLVGIPGESSGAFVRNGSLAYLPGSASGLTATGNKVWTGEALVGHAQSQGNLGNSLG